ncbi:MAG: helix-turn-helix domain-containing protein [Candidatus Thorarchaeota archaeon]
MSEESENSRLRSEIAELRMTVQSLRKMVTELNERLAQTSPPSSIGAYAERYSVAKDARESLFQDASWSKLINILRDASDGMTAAELARQWGKSRSRTSEVLNRMAKDGQVVKYRDGREIKFRVS